VDNQWSYMKTHGDAGWEARPSYYDVFFDTTLKALDALDMRITFFVVGRDAVVPAHHGPLRAVIAAGHEVGNHSFEHEPWLHRYTPEQLALEIGGAEEAIEAATGRRPVGFRGPALVGVPRSSKCSWTRLTSMMPRRFPRISAHSRAPTTSDRASDARST